jgi:hypothetical protein
VAALVLVPGACSSPPSSDQSQTPGGSSTGPTTRSALPRTTASPVPATHVSPSPTVDASPAPSSGGPQRSLPPGADWVRGTHVAIAPPTGYRPSSTFNGFEHETDGLDIVVSELPAGPFDATDANLARGGYVVGSRERTNRDGQSRQLFDGEQTFEGKTVGRMLLSIGPADTSALVIADYPLDDRERRDRIRIALQTVILDPGRSIEPGVALDFEATPTPPLRLAGSLGSAAVYNTLGYLHPLDSLIPTLTVRPMDGDPPTDAAAFLRDQLDGMHQQLLPGVSLPPVPTTIGGVPATQLATTAMDNLHDMNRRLFVYQVLLVEPGGTRWVHMSAVATQQVEGQLLPAFRATAESFRWR